MRVLCCLSHSAGDGAGPFAIESERASQKFVGLQASEQQVGIGHRRLKSASIADRAGIGARRFWADAQRASGIEVCQRASAGANGVDIEHGHTHRQTGDLGFVARLRLAVHQRDIGRGASHIEGEDALEAAEPRHRGCSHNSAGGSG